jgi:hypothetical protein
MGRDSSAEGYAKEGIGSDIRKFQSGSKPGVEPKLLLMLLLFADAGCSCDQAARNSEQPVFDRSRKNIDRKLREK